MEKHVVVKQKHLYNQKKNIMYKGKSDYVNKDASTTLSYVEYDGNTKVKVIASLDDVRIQREGEFKSSLHYIPYQKTKGNIMTEFGSIEIEIYTHKYIRKENIIAIEYDVLQSDEVLEGYRIIWDIKEAVS